MKMRKIAILLVLTVFVFAGDKKEQQEKTDIIKKYIVNEQMRYMSDGFFQKQINDSRDDFPNVPDSVWKEVYDSVNQKETTDPASDSLCSGSSSRDSALTGIDFLNA